MALSSLLALTAAEVAVRVLAPQQLILLRPDIWIPDDGLGWRMASGLDTLVNTGEGPVLLRTDARGLRVASREETRPEGAPVEPVRILALGDSFLVALQVEAEDIFVNHLAADLSRTLGRPVAVDNTGVGGYGPNHYRILAQELLQPGAYDLALVFLFLGNDVETRRREAFAPKQAEIRHGFRRPRDLSRRELVSALVYPVNDALETRSHLFVLFRKQAWRVLMRLGLSARAFPAADLKAEAGSPRWEVTGSLCQETAALARAAGTPVLFVLLPGIYHVDDRVGLAYGNAVGHRPEEVDLGQSARLLTAQLEKRGLEVIDTTPVLRRSRAGGTETHGRVDTHLSVAGHREVAAAILPRVQALVSAPEEPTGETEPGSELPRSSRP